MTLKDIKSRAQIIERCYKADPNDCYDLGDLLDAVDDQHAHGDIPRLIHALEAAESVAERLASMPSETNHYWARQLRQAIAGELEEA